MRGRALGPGRLSRRKNADGSIVYIGEWTDADRSRIRRVLSSDRRVASQLLADIIRRRDLEVAGLVHEEQQRGPISELKDRYLADLATRATQGHYYHARLRLEHILAGCNVSTVQDITPTVVLDWRRGRLAEGVSNRTANMDVSTLSSLLNWAVRSELLTTNPLHALKPLPQGKAHERRSRRALSEIEVYRFLTAADEDDKREAARNAATITIAHGTKGKTFLQKPRKLRIPQSYLWRMFLATGARWSELTRTTWHDFNNERRLLALRAEYTKSGKARILPLQKEMADSLCELANIQTLVLRRNITDSDAIFMTPEGRQWPRATRNAMRIFERILNIAEIVKTNDRRETIDIHALRHTFASRLARCGVGLIQAQKLLGHSDPKLTAAIYTHLDEEDLRKAIEQIPTPHPPDPPRIPGSKLPHHHSSYRSANPNSLRIMERATGFEPATFSLGSALPPEEPTWDTLGQPLSSEDKATD